MTKFELIARLADRHPRHAAKDVEVVVKTLLDAMIQSLVKGQRIEIRGFGSFAIKNRPPRLGRHPKTGESVSVVRH